MHEEKAFRLSTIPHVRSYGTAVARNTVNKLCPKPVYGQHRGPCASFHRYNVFDHELGWMDHIVQVPYLFTNSG